MYLITSFANLTHLWRGSRVSDDWRDGHHDPRGEIAALLLVGRRGALEGDGVQLREPVAPRLQRSERLGLAATKIGPLFTRSESRITKKVKIRLRMIQGQNRNTPGLVPSLHGWYNKVIQCWGSDQSQHFVVLFLVLLVIDLLHVW